MSDLIKREDAIEAVCRDCLREYEEDKCEHENECSMKRALVELPSAEAEPIVIRAKTFMRKEDFDKLAEDIKKQNKSIVCIPCDAEVVSADAVQGEWVFVDSEIFAGEYFCSICGKRAEVDLYGEWILSNYCPSCGKRMKGGVEE